MSSNHGIQLIKMVRNFSKISSTWIFKFGKLLSLLNLYLWVNRCECDRAINIELPLETKDATKQECVSYTSNIIDNKFPIAFVKIVRLDANIDEFKNNQLQNVQSFISDNNRKALEWQLLFVASPSSESSYKHFVDNYEEIKKKSFSDKQAYRFWKLFFFNDPNLKTSNKLIKSQKKMLEEMNKHMKLLVSKGIEKRISTYANEISYTQAKTIASKKELLRFISKLI